MQVENLSPMGRRIRIGMASAGIVSESDLARRVGVSRQTVRRWLYDPLVRVEAVTLFRLSDALHLSARWIVTGQGCPTPRMSLTPSAQQLIEIYDALPAAARTVLLSAAAHLVDP